MIRQNLYQRPKYRRPAAPQVTTIFPWRELLIVIVSFVLTTVCGNIITFFSQMRLAQIASEANESEKNLERTASLYDKIFPLIAKAEDDQGKMAMDIDFSLSLPGHRPILTQSNFSTDPLELSENLRNVADLFGPMVAVEYRRANNFTLSQRIQFEATVDAIRKTKSNIADIHIENPARLVLIHDMARVFGCKREVVSRFHWLDSELRDLHDCEMFQPHQNATPTSANKTK